MSNRFRILLFTACAATVALHAPRCLDSLSGVERYDPAPSAVASLEVSHDTEARAAEPEERR